MLKNFIKLLFIALSCFSSFCAIIEEPESKTVDKTFQILSGCRIVRYSTRGVLVRLLLIEKESGGQLSYYFRKKQIKGFMYLCPILGDKTLKSLSGFNDPKLKQKSWDYILLHACEIASLEIVQQALANGADPLARDYGDNSVIFYLENNGQKCSFDVLFDNPEGVVIKNPKIIIENKLFAGRSTYGWIPANYAENALALDIAVELDKKNTGGKSYSVQDVVTLKENIKWHEENIEQAQDNVIIPNYEIEDNQEIDTKLIENFREFPIGSFRNPDLKLKILLGKNFIKVISDKENKYKKKYLDLDTLATLYSLLIFWNSQDGQRISNLFNIWSANAYFGNLVFYCLMDEMQDNAYSLNNQIQLNNVNVIAKYLIQNFDKFESGPQKLFFLRDFFRYLFVLSHEPDGPKEEYQDLLKLLLSSPKTNLLLKSWVAKDELFRPEVKKAIQLYLLKSFILRMLLRADPPFPEEIAQQIVEFWQPDEKFMESFRKPKTKLEKIKNFFSLKKK